MRVRFSPSVQPASLLGAGSQNSINKKLENNGELSEESLKFIRLKVREGRLSQTAMLSIIMMRGMETEKQVISRLEKLIEKEVDREKKRIVDEHRQLLQRFDHKCEICDVRFGRDERAMRREFKLGEGLMCQDCYRIVYLCFGESEILKKVAKYIDLKNGKS